MENLFPRTMQTFIFIIISFHIENMWNNISIWIFYIYTSGKTCISFSVQYEICQSKFHVLYNVQQLTYTMHNNFDVWKEKIYFVEFAKWNECQLQVKTTFSVYITISSLNHVVVEVIKKCVNSLVVTCSYGVSPLLKISRALSYWIFNRNIDCSNN